MQEKLTWMAVVFLAAILMASHGGMNACFAAQPAASDQEQREVFDAHDTGVRFHFNDTERPDDFHRLPLKKDRKE